MKSLTATAINVSNQTGGKIRWWVLLASLATIQLTFLAPHFAVILKRNIKLEWMLSVSIASTVIVATSYTLAENIVMRKINSRPH